MMGRPTHRPRHVLLLFAVLVFAVAISYSLGAGGSASGGRDSELAASAFDPVEAPLLLFDPAARVMQLRMAGRKVWEIPFEPHSGNKLDVGVFFMSLAEANRGSFSIASRHLYEGRGVFDEAELAIVGDELGVDPARLQRTYPGRFALAMPGGYTLEVFTEIDASPASRADNLCFNILRFIDAPFGGRCLRITMDSTDALTLYNIARPGLPVVIAF